MNGLQALQTRNKLGVNQSQFWSRVGVTQSGGSRYESGRNVPKPVQMLLTLAYGSDKDSDKLLAGLKGA